MAELLGLDLKAHHLTMLPLLQRSIAQARIDPALWRVRRMQHRTGLRVAILEWRPSVRDAIDRACSRVLAEGARARRLERAGKAARAGG